MKNQQQQLCTYKYCYYNIAKKLSQSEKEMIQNIACPLCRVAIYCSTRCRDLDLNTHKQQCVVPSPSKSSLGDMNDTDPSLRSIRRSQEDFEIIKKDNKADLGKGSYGCVKLVRDKSNNQYYAMKIMNKKQIFEYCTVENLKREIKIQRKLQHPHVTKLFHYFEDKDNVYLILEYAENGSLFNYLRKRRKLPENEAFVYFYQTCLGIDYLHKKNIIHRDLKPENLLLDKQGNIKLCDFGWSAETAGVNQKRSTFCGTIDYMAPEMLQNQSHDYTLDIWCVGILLYELVHGYAPYKGKNDNEKCQSIVKNVPIQYDPSISSDCKNLIRDILKYHPQERLPMKHIFEHTWMKTQAKFYQIDIQQYIYKETNESLARQKTEFASISPQTQIPAPNQRNRQFQSLNDTDLQYFGAQNKQAQSDYIKPNALIKTQHAQPDTKKYQTYADDDNFKNRVSRVSQRNHQAQQMQEVGRQPLNGQDPGLMDRVFMALGCLNRDKQALPQQPK